MSKIPELINTWNIDEQERSKRRLEYFRSYRKTHPQENNAYQKKYREHSNHYKNYVKTYSKEYYKNNKESIISYSKQWRNMLSIEILTHYGGKCACCGFDDINMKIYDRRFLQLDHINGGGTKERRLLGSYNKLFFLLKKNGFPSGYRVLCGGCNHAMVPGENKCLLHKERGE